MLTPQPTDARPSTNDRDYIQVDAGLHPEMYRLADGNGNRVPRGCAYAPLAIANTPEYQAVIGRSIGFANAANQWSAIAGDFIEARKSVKLANSYSPEQAELIESMKSALGAGIAKAMQAKEDNERRHDEAAVLLAEMERPESEQRRNDPNSNTSRMAILHAANEERNEKIEKDGCCGEEPMSDGVCFGYGMCPRTVEIKTCETFSKGVIQWAEEVNEQSALAAIAARLSVPSPVIDSEGSNV
jgi:hypothetical protein